MVSEVGIWKERGSCCGGKAMAASCSSAFDLGKRLLVLGFKQYMERIRATTLLA